MNFKVLFFVVILVCLSPLITYSQPYYADIDIEIIKMGTAHITGLSSIPSLQTPLTTDQFTSKEGKYWTFNLTTEETLNSYVYELTLPEDANLNYIKTSENFRLEDSQGKLKIIGSGEDKPLEIILQYSFSSQEESSSTLPFLIGTIVVLIAIIGSGFVYLFMKKTSTNNSSSQKEEENNPVSQIDTSLLSPRQKEIIDILLEKEKISQKALEELVSIPKSSLSRNLKTLQVKGYIRKEQIGQTNYIILVHPST